MPNATSTNPNFDPGPGRFAASVGELDRDSWNRANRGGGPFADHRFLGALEASGCLGPGTGWSPCPLVDERADAFAALPAYLKSHSRGEFVFDWAWARASEGAGIPWYPKLLVASPFTPVTGTRLLGAEAHPELAAGLIGRIERTVEQRGYSSAAINFCDPVDARLLQDAGWLARRDWQFHWTNPGYRDFDDFLDSLKRKPRKNIRRERRLAREAGWSFDWLDGGRLDADTLEFIYQCYRATFLRYGNWPALNAAFFRRVAADFADRFLVCVAKRHGRPQASAVFWRDGTRLYGRYWGSLAETRDAHFEACYYQGIEYCIREGLQAFEPGAQGEYKIRRGFLPVATRSFHYIRHPGLKAGIRRWLKMEARALDDYRRLLDEMNPFAPSHRLAPANPARANLV